MIGMQMYYNVRPLRYKRLAGRWCSQYSGIARSLCVTMAIKLLKRCDHRWLGNAVDCINTAKAQLDRYMARVMGGHK